MNKIALDNFEAANMSDLSEVQGGTNVGQCVAGAGGAAALKGLEWAGTGVEVGSWFGPEVALPVAIAGGIVGLIAGGVQGANTYCR